MNQKIFFLLIFYGTPLLGNTYYSQFGQDKFVNEQFFHDKTNGIFVDIGAHDGIFLSNTYFFEQQRNWRGICVEPLPEVYKELCKNRTCYTVKGCIAPFNGPAALLQVIGYSEMLSGLVDNYDPRHLQRIHHEVQERGGKTQEIEVTCFRINDLLENYQFYHIDYVSLDIEGGELEVLKSIDFDRFIIDVIDVENNYNDPQIKSFLTSKGYKFVTKLGCDEIYTLK